MSLLKKIIKDTGKFSAASFIQMFANLVVSYYKALILGPANMGALNISNISLEYSYLSSLGIPFIIRRDLPQLKGENNDAEADNLVSIGFTFILLTALIYSIIILILSFFINDNKLVQFCLHFFVPITYIYSVNGYYNMITKGLNRYGFLSKITLIRTGLNLFVILPAIFYFKIYGILLGRLGVELLILIIYFSFSKIKFNFIWDFSRIKKLIFNSFPILLVNISTSVFTSVDRLLIAYFLTTTQVGLYVLGNFISNPLYILASTFGVVLFTNLNQEYGKDYSPEVIKKHFEKPISVLSKIFPVLIGGIVIVLPLIVNLFLPKYINGIFAAQILIFGIFFKLMSGFVSNALFILNKQKITTLHFIIAGSFNIVLSSIALYFGYGIEGVALSTSLSFLIYNALMLNSIYKAINLKKIVLKKYVEFYLPLFISVLLVIIIITFVKFNINNIINTIIQLFIFIIVTVPFWINHIKQIKI